jgi:hypothetical protein
VSLFAEPFSWLKPVGDFLGSASKAVGDFDDKFANSLGSINWEPGGPLGQISYRAPGQDRPQERPRTVSNNSFSSDNILKALAGGYNSPAVSGEGIAQGVPPSLMEPEPVDEYELRAQKIRDMMAELEAGGPGSDNAAMVDEAFAGSLAAIANARNSAQSNYQESDRNVQDLTAGHVNEIKTKDRSAIETNANELTGAYNTAFTDGRNQLIADQNRETSARAEMLKRLGIQEAGMGNAGQAQSEAITRLTEDNTGRQRQAAGYKAADLTRNTELASSQASAGVERQADLRRQLNDINADLDQSQASVENAKATARISANNADQKDFLSQMEFYNEQLRDIQSEKERADDRSYDRARDERDFLAKSGGNTGGALDIASQNVMNTGHDPQQYAEAYALVSEENAYDSRSGKDKISDTVQRMRKRNPNLDPSVALRYVMSIENFGTDKGNTPLG